VTKEALIGALINRLNPALKQETLRSLRGIGLHAAMASSDRLLCLHCYETIANRSVYLEIHLASCDKTPRDERIVFAARVENSKSLQSRLGHAKLSQVLALAQEARPPVTPRFELQGRSAVCSPPQPAPVLTNSTYSPFPVGDVRRGSDRSLTEAQLYRFESRLSTFFFKKNLPFELLADKELRDILNDLNTTYNRCSMLKGYRIRNKYLNDAYMNVKATTTSLLQASKSVCLLMDGWSSIRRKHYLNIVVSTPRPIFIEVVPTGSASVTAQLQCHEISDSIRRHGLDIDGFCSDHASVMKSTWKLLKQAQPTLICYGCAAHAIQSLGKSIASLDIFKDMLGKANKIIVYFRTHTQNLGLATLNEAQVSIYGEERALVQATETRWHASHDSAASLTKSKQSLLDIVNSEAWRRSKDSSKQELNTIINDYDNFWDQLEEYTKLTAPIKLIIHFLESDRSNLSDVLAGFLALSAHFRSSLSSADLLAGLHARARKALLACHLVAFLLNPKYVVAVNIPNYEACQLVTSLCIEMFPTMGMQTVAYEASDYFDAVNEHNSYPHLVSFWRAEHTRLLTPDRWWSTMNNKFPNLRRVADKLLQFPASAAATERVWSAAGDILGTKRTRLLSSALDKLLFIRCNSQLSEDVPNEYTAPKELQQLLDAIDRDIGPFIQHLIRVFPLASHTSLRCDDLCVFFSRLTVLLCCSSLRAVQLQLTRKQVKNPVMSSS
jgi:hypothetical protein